MNLYTRETSSSFHPRLPFPARESPRAAEEAIPASLQEGKGTSIPGTALLLHRALQAGAGWPSQQRLNDNGMACARRLLTLYGSGSCSRSGPTHPGMGSQQGRTGLPTPRQGPRSLPSTQLPAPGARHVIRSDIAGTKSWARPTRGCEWCPLSLLQVSPGKLSPMALPDWVPHCPLHLPAALRAPCTRQEELLHGACTPRGHGLLIPSPSPQH